MRLPNEPTSKGLCRKMQTPEEFLTLFEKTVSRNKEKRIFEKALNYLLTDFGKLYQQAEIRPQVFQLVGNLKMELM